MSEIRSLLGGLDGMAVARAWQFDRPPQVQEEVERVYAEATWWADVWLRLYGVDGQTIYDAVLPGRVQQLNGSGGWASMLTLADYPADLNLILATHGASLSYLWMETGERRPPESRPGLSTPYVPPKELMPVGKFVVVGGLILMLWMLGALL